MSRIGRLPVEITKGVEVTISPDNEVSIKSAQKLLKVQVNSVINVQVKDGSVILTRKNDEPKSRAWHGLYRALIQNAVTGVSKGWTKTLIFKGVGYKANVAGKYLEMILGYSHPIKMEIPEGLTVKVEKTNIMVSGADRAQVGQFSAQIRSWREPEPYLGKGIRYSDEVIRRKAGKSGGEK
ncbi:MAG: 50S ribosomal protein L6 [Oligoflexia bacterium]|nr:50S ribosomal protein L6 [Bdellovibrionales bacterium]MYE07172.1 50S ribosomal protein L6 [Oligoflexia bacterium]